MHSFESYEEFAVALGHPGLRLMKLDRESARWAMTHIDLAGVPVRWARYGGRCFLDAAVSADGIGVVIGTGEAGQLSGNNRALGRHSILVIPGRAQVRAASMRAAGWLSVFVPVDRFGPRWYEDRRLHQASCYVADVDPLSYRAFRNLLHRIVHAAEAGDLQQNLTGRRAAACELVDAVTSLLSESSTGDPCVPGRRRVPRSSIIESALYAIDQKPPGSCLALANLALAAGVSERTVRNAFHEQFGVSPTRFMRVWELHAARNKLLQADSKTIRVTDVLTELGIWEWGRFSGDYFRLFGERPSQTLREERKSGHQGRGVLPGSMLSACLAQSGVPV